MTGEIGEKGWKLLVEELENFRSIAHFLKPAPGEIPVLPGIDIAGISTPLNGILGGDHILYVDFNRRFDLDARIERAKRAGRSDVAEELRRNKSRAGILVADVAGHRITDALLAAMLHQAFLLGAYYELDTFGSVTTKIFENINARFYESSTVNKYLTMIYGEISDTGKFRFISAAHPAPKVFSREFGRIMKISADRTVSFPPIGMFQSAEDVDAARRGRRFTYARRYTVNEINLLGTGDVLLLHTDGLAEHGGGRWIGEKLEGVLAGAVGSSSAEIVERIQASLLEFAEPEDDVSFVVIQKL